MLSLLSNGNAASCQWMLAENIVVHSVSIHSVGNVTLNEALISYLVNHIGTEMYRSN